MKLLVAWIALFLQVQNPTGSIEGVVLRVGTDAPVAGAQVTVAGTANAGPVTTDEAGRFTIKGLRAGSYDLTVFRNGYARQEFGQRHPAAVGAPIAVTDGQAVKNVEVRLTPAGNVSGHVRNSNGQPAPAVTVQLLRRAYDPNGQRKLQSVATARSDDRGEYRFFWMTPGRYYVVAGSPSIEFDPSRSLRVSDNEVVPIYPYTFFPGSTAFEKARAIDVLPGSEIDSIDFALLKAPLFSIRARVVDPATGQPPRRAFGGISYWSPDGADGWSGERAYDPQTGTVEFTDIPSGVYDISVSTGDLDPLPLRSARSTARSTATVSNADADLGTILLEPSRAITGRITGDPMPNSRPLSSLWVRVLAPEGVSAAMVPTAMNNFLFPASDGTFTAHTSESSVRIAISTLPPGFYVREARIGRADAMNNWARLENSNELEIVVSSKAGQLEGLIRGAGGQAVAGARAVLIPDAARHRPELFKEARSDQNGRFLIHSIPPGDYMAFAWDALEPYSYFDPEVLKKYEPQGRSIHIVESARDTVDLRLIQVEVD